MLGATRQTGIAFETGFPWSSPVDLDTQLLSDQVQRELSPTALRNVGAAGSFFEGVIPSPIRELARPQTVLGAQLPRPISLETIPQLESPIGQGSFAVSVGR